MTHNPLNTIFYAKRLIGHKFLDKKVQEDIKHWLFKIIKDENSYKQQFQVTYQKNEREFYP